VLQVLPEVDPGGAERIVLSLARHLPHDRFRVELAALDGRGAMAEQFRALGCPVHDLGLAPPDGRLYLTSYALSVWRSRRRLRQLINKVRPEIVHSHLFRAHLAAAHAPGCPGVRATLATEHQADPRRWALGLIRRATRRTSCVTAVSGGVHRHLAAHGFEAARLETIPNGIELSPIDQAAPLSAAELGLPEGAHIALFVGRWTPQKGVDVLLEAMRKLVADVPDLHLVMACGKQPSWGGQVFDPPTDGPPLLRAWGLEGRAHFLGYRDDVPRLMKTAHLVVLPSRWEGLSLVLLEAMAAGRPVVATAVEGQSEVLADGVNGLLVPRENPGALAAAMRRVLDDAPLASRLAAAAAEKARSDHSAETMASRYAALYDRLLARL
jgi:glycosyltransferase involved in cell wall biosynthesis